MKYLIFLISLSALALQTMAQVTQPFATAYSPGRIYSTAVDAQENMYVLGGFYKTLESPTTVPIFSEREDGSAEKSHLLIKQTPEGEVLWHKQGWCKGRTEYPGDVVTAPDGSVYFTMAFEAEDTIYFDDLVIPMERIEPDPNYDPSILLVGKLNTNGDLLWHKTLFGFGTLYNTLLSVDGNGDLIIASSVRNNIQVVDSVYTFGYSGILLQKYTSNGDLLWVRADGSKMGNARVMSLCADREGGIYLTGSYIVPFRFSSDTDSLINYNETDNTFIAKISQAGKALWAYGNTDIEFAIDLLSSVVVDDSLNVFVSGYYYSGTFSIQDTVFVNPFGKGVISTFYGKLNANSGKIEWLVQNDFQQLTGEGYYFYRIVPELQTRQLYLVGETWEPEMRIAGKNIPTVAPIGGGLDLFVFKANYSGEALGVLNLGSTGLDRATNLNNINSDYLLLAGSFASDEIVLPCCTVEAVTKYDNNYITAIRKSDIPTGVVTQVATEESITVYPNPTMGTVTVRIAESAGVTITVCNVLGKQVKQLESTSATTQVNLAHVPKGVYTLRVTHASGKPSQTQRVVVK